MPNFFVEAVTVADGKVHTEAREIVVPPETRVLNVAVEPVADDVQAGPEGQGQAQADRPRRQAVRRLDRADRLRQGASSTSPAARTCRRSRSSSGSGGGATTRRPSRASTAGSATWSSRTRSAMQRPGHLRRRIDGDAMVERSTARCDGSGGMGGMGGMMGGMGGGWQAAAARCPPLLPAAAMMAGDGQAESGPCIGHCRRSEGKDADLGRCLRRRRPAGPAHRPHELRRHRLLGRRARRPTATAPPRSRFTHAREPDRPGRSRSGRMGHGTKVGQGEAEVVTTKDLLVRLQAPRFFVQKDEVVLSANVHNYLKTQEVGPGRRSSCDGSVLAAARRRRRRPSRSPPAASTASIGASRSPTRARPSSA